MLLRTHLLTRTDTSVRGTHTRTQNSLASLHAQTHARMSQTRARASKRVHLLDERGAAETEHVEYEACRKGRRTYLYRSL